MVRCVETWASVYEVDCGLSRGKWFGSRGKQEEGARSGFGDEHFEVARGKRGRGGVKGRGWLIERETLPPPSNTGFPARQT